jgi:hypothetical protein
MLPSFMERLSAVGTPTHGQRVDVVINAVTPYAYDKSLRMA